MQTVIFLNALLYFFFLQGNCSDSIPVKGYSLTWSDEFNGKELDTRKWNYRGLGKRDQSYMVKETVKLDGKGHLIIGANERNDSVFTGMISTENIASFKYGYFECKAKFAKAQGTISAFWLQSGIINGPNSTPEKNGAEIDIFEYFPHLSKDHVYHTLHWGGYEPGRHRVEGPVLGKLGQADDDFHVIGLEWKENGYKVFVDGKETYSGNQFVSHVSEFIILSLGVNEQSAGPLNKKSLPETFIIDYVRVYKKNSSR